MWVAEYSGSWLAIARLFQTDISQEDQNWQGRPVMPAKIGLARLIVAAKLVQGNQFWQIFLPKSVQPDQF